MFIYKGMCGNMIQCLIESPIFQFIGIICSILGAIIGLLAIIPKTRAKFFSYKQNIKIGQQTIRGSENVQSGGNISSKDAHISDVNYNEKVMIKKQTIVGDNNKQAGGDINE
jgi:hypothetical protein